MVLSRDETAKKYCRSTYTHKMVLESLDETPVDVWAIDFANKRLWKRRENSLPIQTKILAHLVMFSDNMKEDLLKNGLRETIWRLLLETKDKLVMKYLVELRTAIDTDEFAQAVIYYQKNRHNIPFPDSFGDGDCTCLDHAPGHGHSHGHGHGSSSSESHHDGDGDDDAQDDRDIGMLSGTCSNCFLKDNALKNCSGCLSAQYCGRTCQVSHWRNGHKEKCKEIAAQLAGLNAQFRKVSTS
eukprot:TRINITY_DN6851_c0_g2_i1.p1 TRINITY_DN6851_c0_g2~~TRINITY_DN6851_c0_g2_i1.p1  ORF type:complete len:241 (-),score=50.67 TRINITY_DN6851_c0_g2_i1:50-772(-)